MSIQVLPYIEPLTRASQAQPAIIIQSVAYRRMVADLDRYVRGQIDGRSFLVAGHRGAGKTTMVRKAIEEVVERCEGIDAKPLLVLLHGPSLLEPPRTAAPPGKPGEQAPSVKADETRPAPAGESADTAEKPAAPAITAPEQPATADARFRFLDRVASGLWAATAQEFVRAMWEYAAENDEQIEIAAQFRVELDLPPELDRLRAFWSNLGALKSGILFPTVAGHDRGADEIIALYRLGRALRPIYGKTEESQETTATATKDSSVSLVTIEGQNLLRPLMGLASGALVWSGLPSASHPLLAAFTSILTGLSTVLALKWSETRTQNRTQTWKDKFIPNNDAPSLYRVLPELVQSLRGIGLCPVFVVDELDKVPELGLDRQLDDLLGYLKQFVAERAFFCFLTDRAFYEWNEQRVAGGPYSIAHTRFGDRLFVRYDAADIHEFMDNLIPDSAEQTDDEKSARVLIRYIAMHRSYMHPYDLRRLVGRWTRDGALDLNPLDVINRSSFNRDVVMEVAVELMLRKPSLQEYLYDPSHAQIALDALYYPSRCWHDLKQEFDAHELEEYLVGRTGMRRDRPADSSAEDRKVIRSDLLKELGERVEELMAWLVDPALLLEQAKAAALPGPVLKVLGTAKPIVVEVEAN